MFFHGNFDKLCTTGWKARYYLKIFTYILPLQSDLKTMTRFEIKARLSEGTYVDYHQELEHDFQYVWDVIIAMWEGLEWIHLPVIHIKQSMERVIEFVTSTQVPKRFRCFNDKRVNRGNTPCYGRVMYVYYKGECVPSCHPSCM